MKENLSGQTKVWRWGPVRGWPLTGDFPVTGITQDMATHCGLIWDECMTMYKDGEMMWLQDEQWMMKTSCDFFKRALMGVKERDLLYDQYKKVLPDLDSFARGAYVGTLTKLDDDALAKRFEEWFTANYLFWGVASPGETSTFGGEVILRELVEQHHSGKEAVEIMEVLSSPLRVSFFQEAERELLLASLEADTERALNEYLDLYYWTENGYYGAARRTIDSVNEQLSQLLREHRTAEKGMEHIVAYENGLQARRDAVRARFNLNDEVMEVSEALGFAISWQDERKAEQMKQMDVLQVFLGEFERRFGQNIEDMWWLRSPELLEYMRDPKKVSKMASSRKSGAVALGDGADVEIWGGEKGRELVECFWESTSDDDYVSGVVASFGSQNQTSVEGVAQVVMQYAVDHPFEKGQVLVAPMTSPDYMPFIRQASAIVTDEGGLTAHAAVVARELGVPCIVGTGNATKRIATGDRVILNLESGEITITQ